MSATGVVMAYVLGSFIINVQPCIGALCPYVDSTGSNKTVYCSPDFECCVPASRNCCSLPGGGSPWYVWLAFGLGILLIGVITMAYHRYRYLKRNRIQQSVRDEAEMTSNQLPTSFGRPPARPIFVQPPAGSHPPPMPYSLPGQPPPYSPTGMILATPPPPYGFVPSTVNGTGGGPYDESDASTMSASIDDDLGDEKAFVGIQPMQPAYRMPSAKFEDATIDQITRQQLHMQSHQQQLQPQQQSGLPGVETPTTHT